MRSLWWLVATCFADIILTKKQIKQAERDGLNTTYLEVGNVRTGTSFRGASDAFAENWESPQGFNEQPGVNHLLIPYRFKTEDYTAKQMKTMRDGLNEMSTLLDKCIEFYDDTE